MPLSALGERVPVNGLGVLGRYGAPNKLGVPPCGRAYFLLLRQKKVAKEKATPGSAPFGSLALLGAPGGWLNSPAAQTTPAEYPRPACVAQRLSWGPEKHPQATRDTKNTVPHGQLEKKPKNETHRFSVDAFLGPLRGTEQRRGWREKGEDCLRAKPEFRSPRQNRVAQGTGNAGTDPGVAFSLATFFWRSKRKYARPQGGTPSQLKLQSPKTTQNPASHGQPEKIPKIKISTSNVDASPGPLRGAEQRWGWRIKGEDCLRAKPEFRSPRQSRVAQGTGVAGTDPGSPFLCLLSFGEAKESKPPRKGGNPAKMKPLSKKQRIQPC